MRFRGAGLLALVMATSGAVAAVEDVVRSVDRPFGRKPHASQAQPARAQQGGPAPLAQPAAAPAAPAAPIAPAGTPGAALPDAAQPPQIARPAQWQHWSLRVADGTVERAFERWARERKVALRWLVGRDLPVDAGAETVIPNMQDYEQAAAEGSSDPELVAAMMKVARAFWQSKSPFVVREYDNAILVMPKAEVRP